MRINLAKVVPWLGVALVAVLWIVGKTSADAEVGYESSSDHLAFGDTARADSYLDGVAQQLAQPGVYVDPSVTSISRAASERLDRLAASTPGPVRVAVVPADPLRGKDPATITDVYLDNPVAYDEAELVAQLYDRVGVDGTYAVLVDAPGADDGRSFSAYQFSEERPFYDVEGALDAAVDCCAPDYDSMVETFLENAGDEKTDPWPVVGWVALGGALLVGALVGMRTWLAHAERRREDAQVADALRPGLNEEVIDLEHQVGALPPPPSGTVAAETAMFGAGEGATVEQRTRTVLDLVEEARHRLDATDGDARMDTPDDVEQVVKRLADARYELVAITALRSGQPVPERTAPCFFDPRHGPSVDQRAFTPSYGSQRQVPVCARCRDELDAKQTPAVYEIAVGDAAPKPYWDWDRYSRPYVNGYWQRYQFADDRVQRSRYGAAPVLGRRSLVDDLDGGDSGRPVQFVWESSGGGSFWGSGGGSGGRGFSGRSRSRRSFGGGSSRRSRRRSGGSRRF